MELKQFKSYLDGAGITMERAFQMAGVEDSEEARALYDQTIHNILLQAFEVKTEKEKKKAPAKQEQEPSQEPRRRGYVPMHEASIRYGISMSQLRDWAQRKEIPAYTTAEGTYVHGSATTRKKRESS